MAGYEDAEFNPKITELPYSPKGGIIRSISKNDEHIDSVVKIRTKDKEPLPGEIKKSMEGYVPIQTVDHFKRGESRLNPLMGMLAQKHKVLGELKGDIGMGLDSEFVYWKENVDKGPEVFANDKLLSEAFTEMRRLFKKEVDLWREQQQLKNVRTCPLKSGSDFISGCITSDKKPQIQAGEGIAIKNDKDKQELSLIPYSLNKYASAALKYGTINYGKNNWKRGFEWHRIWDAIMRHMNQFWEGEDDDEESKLPHLAHAAASLAMLIEHFDKDLGRDDR